MIELLRSALDPAPAPVPPVGDRLAAVLAPLIVEGDPSLLFTRRHDDMTRHAGEVSFPGGLPHEGDDDLRATALRETHEEVGIPASAIEVIGALQPVHTTVSGILVVPFVGVIEERVPLSPSPSEIAEVFEETVGHLMEVEAVIEMERDGRRFQTYMYDVGDHVIWGATGRMLHELLQIVRAGLS